jgi:SAM-dependent methyltransferase
MSTEVDGDPMSFERWLSLDNVEALLDVGCNVGHLLQYVADLKPQVRLAGVEVNPEALQAATKALPQASLHLCGAEALPFADNEFDRATCIEVLEHIPAGLRRQSLEEVHRVLKTDGTLLLQVPHAGAFDWLDPGNFRFRFPSLYSALLGRGLREQGMQSRAEGVQWHHHFSLAELEDLSKGLFTIVRVHYGGLFLMPLADIARWPFYRRGVYDGWLFRLFAKTARWDLARDYGSRSYDVRLLLKKRDL